VAVTLLDEYLTEEDCARELHRHPRTLKRWRDRGDGPPYIDLYNRILYARTSVSKWLASLERQGRQRAVG
jgi:hypothetical protein